MHLPQDIACSRTRLKLSQSSVRNHVASSMATWGIVVFAIVAFLWSSPVTGAPIQPFEATVQASAGEDVYARSGPGKGRFYSTMKLQNGQKVLVIRKDPGGWFMIEPPEGSFSWILAQYVDRNGPLGTVNENAAVVRVGAFNSNQRDVEQVRLNKGDPVEVMGEETFEAEKGGKHVKESWLKIKPPRGEYRWVKGSSLVELTADGKPKVLAPKQPKDSTEDDQDLKAAKPGSRKIESHTAAMPVTPKDSDAPKFGNPSEHHELADQSEPDLGEGISLGTMSRSSDQKAIRRELQVIGEKMLAMRQHLPETQWDYSVIEPELLALQQAASGTASMPLVELRLRELRRDKLIHQNAIELGQRQQRPPAFTQMLPNRPVDRNGVPIDPRGGVYGPAASPGSDPTSDRPATSGQAGLAPQPPLAPNSASSRFQGAGIVARVRHPAPNMPRYVLIKPNGQLLCYLDGEPGLNFERYVGQSMGINGPRGFDPQLKADRLRVQKLTPVQLAQ